MASKEVTDRKKAADEVFAATEAHADEAAGAIAAKLEAVLARGEHMPDVALLIRLVGRWIARDNGALVAADDAHAHGLDHGTVARGSRDGAMDSVSHALSDLRTALGTAYGDGALAAMHAVDAPSHDPAALARQAGAVVTALRDSSVHLPAALRRGVRIDRHVFADEIEAQLPTLVASLREVTLDGRQTASTQSAKDAAMVANDTTFQHGADWLRQTLELGGLTGAAARVRPSHRRRGHLATSAGAPAAASGTGNPPPAG